MYRVLLVDDEILVRDAIRRNIDWQKLGYELAGDCQNGKEAIEFVQEHPVDLVLVGVERAADIPCGKRMDQEVRSHITCYRYIEKAEELFGLQAGAKAFLFLSLIEGFGFPPLEAMQLGVPVICSNRTALPEVVGDAALLTDPDDLEQTVGCINRVLEDEELRRRLVQRGYENMKRFDWDSRTKAYWEELTR